MYASFKDEFDLPAFERLLDSTVGEREVAAFLKKSPRILYWTICELGGHDRYLFSEFPLGNDYKTDFVALNSYSGVWEAHFIELEGVDDPVFTKNRTPTKRVATAIRQIDDWRTFLTSNFSYVRAQLVKWAKQRDLLGYSTRKDPSNYSGDRLADPETPIRTRFTIIVGRSSKMPKERRLLLGRFGEGHSLQIVSYDRILRAARRRYSRRT